MLLSKKKKAQQSEMYILLLKMLLSKKKLNILFLLNSLELGNPRNSLKILREFLGIPRVLAMEFLVLSLFASF